WRSRQGRRRSSGSGTITRISGSRDPHDLRLKKGHGSFLGIPVVAGDQGIRGGPIPYHPLLYLFAALVVPCRDNIDLPITSHRPPEIGILVEYSRLQRIAVHILHPACPVCYRRGDDLITERSSGYIGFAMVIDT